MPGQRVRERPWGAGVGIGYENRYHYLGSIGNCGRWGGHLPGPGHRFQGRKREGGPESVRPGCGCEPACADPPDRDARQGGEDPEGGTARRLLYRPCPGGRQGPAGPGRAGPAPDGIPVPGQGQSRRPAPSWDAGLSDLVIGPVDADRRPLSRLHRRCLRDVRAAGPGQYGRRGGGSPPAENPGPRGQRQHRDDVPAGRCEEQLASGQQHAHGDSRSHLGPGIRLATGPPGGDAGSGAAKSQR